MYEKLKEKVVQQFIAKRHAFFIAGEQQSENEEVVKNQIAKLLNSICLQEGISLIPKDKEQLISELVEDTVGFGPIKPLLLDPTVTEIMINGSSQIFIERSGKKQLTEITFKSDRQLNRIIEKILRFTRRHVDEVSPYVDASLPDGSRVNIVISPLSLLGPVITIRKFSWDLNKIEDLIRLGTLNENMANFLVACIKARLNLVFSSATGAGKTTTLNILSKYIDNSERIITIEDTAELQLKQKHIVRLQTRQPNIEGKGEISIRDLFRNSLRMRPDRIILGEIRAGEALDMLQAIASGHVGSLSVLHGESPEDAISRIETMIVLSNPQIPISDIRKQIAGNIDAIIQQERFPDGVRRITAITEVRGIDKDGNVETCNLFSFEQEGVDDSGKILGEWVASGRKPLFFPVFKKKGVGLSEEIFKGAK